MGVRPEFMPVFRATREINSSLGRIPDLTTRVKGTRDRRPSRFRESEPILPRYHPANA